MKLTEEEIIRRVNEVYKNNPHPTQTALYEATNIPVKRLKALADQGHFKWPLKIPKSKVHLFKKNDAWRKFVI